MLKRPSHLSFRRKSDPLAEAVDALPPEPASGAVAPITRSSTDACDMNACPKCGFTVQRSRAYSSFEHFRKRFTRKRPHRCLNCGWRGWMLWTRGARRADGWIIHRNAPDFASLSIALAEATGNDPSSDPSDQV
jgi:hypothetical protein